MSKGDNQKKHEYFEKVRRLCREYNRVFVVNVDNVASSQMHQIRGSLRGIAVVLMGKNTMVRKAMREVVAENPKLDALLSCIYGNIGLVFTNGDLKTVRDLIVSNKVQAAAKIGLIAQHDIYVPAGNTGIDPNKTSFFQALGISTKVVKGAIEITADVCIIKTGQKVGASEAALSNMLNMMPFTFGLTVIEVYDNGTVFAPKMLDITDDILTNHLQAAIKNIAALSLQLGIPTGASAPHIMVNAYKRLLGVALATEYSLPAADDIKERLKNPALLASSVPAAAASVPEGKAAAAAPAEEPESEEDLGISLFD